ncbi:MAG: hypothetical protein PUP90_20155 [Nostoc sp. S4]|nr:hypothetical protein [Nostoc sp. S4]
MLNLRCLQADAIKLLAIKPTTQTDTAVALQQKLTKLGTQLQSQYPWQILTLKQATTLLSNPDLVNLAYKRAIGSSVEPLIQVSLWLRDRIDSLAQELGWILMPLPIVSGMRSLREEFDHIRAGLEQQGVHIPLAARGAYRNLESERGSLRMYVIMWLLSETTQKAEWMLYFSSKSSSIRANLFVRFILGTRAKPERTGQLSKCSHPTLSRVATRIFKLLSV